MTDTDIDGLPPAPGGGRRRLAGATMGMAVGTTLSRITGVARIIAQTTALGGAGFADGYNLANTTPNIITDVVIGGVLSATFVPVFVDYLSTRRTEEAWRAISAVVTATVTLLIAATVVFFILTPELIHLYTLGNHNPDVDQQRSEAVFLLRWFVPQLTCYGLIALFTALLNARGKFAAPMFVPIANNLVVIVVMVWFRVLVPHPSLATIDSHHSALVLLGIGTTLGVVVQTALLIPSLLRTDLHVRFLWAPAHQAMRTITRLAGWTFGWVIANQVALFVILALADSAAPGTVTAYNYAYTFFLLPYGVVAVSVMSAVTPSLSARWARRDVDGFRHRMAFGLRGILAIIIPSSVGMLILARPVIDLVLAHGAYSVADAQSTSSALAMFALGLPGFCTFLYMIRVFQSMQDTRTAFKLYLVENAINVVLGVVLVGPLGVRGLALSLSVAYSVAALLAMAVVRQRLGGLGGAALSTPLKRVLGASAAMAVTTVLAVNVSGADSGWLLLGRVVLALVVGSVTYVAAATFLGARQARRSVAERAGRSQAGRSGTGTRVGVHRTPVGADLADRTDPEPFRGRLDGGPVDTPHRHLRPVDDQPGTATGPGEREEEVDDPDPGGNR